MPSATVASAAPDAPPLALCPGTTAAGGAPRQDVEAAGSPVVGAGEGGEGASDEDQVSALSLDTGSIIPNVVTAGVADDHYVCCFDESDQEVSFSPPHINTFEKNVLAWGGSGVWPHRVVALSMKRRRQQVEFQFTAPPPAPKVWRLEPAPERYVPVGFPGQAPPKGQQQARHWAGSNVDMVAAAFSSQPEDDEKGYPVEKYNELSKRVEQCRTVWALGLCEQCGSSGVVGPLNPCGVRLCPLCARQRSKVLGDRVAGVVEQRGLAGRDQVRFKRTKLGKRQRYFARLKLVTLTMPNVEELGSEHHADRREYLRRWMHLLQVKFPDAMPGAFGSWETTVGEHGWNPHIHLLCEFDYIPQQELQDAWQIATWGEAFIVDVQAVRAGNGDVNDAQALRGAVKEVAKYAAKGSDILRQAGRGKFLELHEAIRGQRLAEFYGSWRNDFGDEEAEQVEDASGDVPDDDSSIRTCPDCQGERKILIVVAPHESGSFYELYVKRRASGVLQHRTPRGRVSDYESELIMDMSYPHAFHPMTSYDYDSTHVSVDWFKADPVVDQK